MTRRHGLVAAAVFLAAVAIPAGAIAGGLLLLPHAAAAAWLAIVD